MGKEMLVLTLLPRVPSSEWLAGVTKTSPGFSTVAADSGPQQHRPEVPGPVSDTTAPPSAGKQREAPPAAPGTRTPEPRLPGRRRPRRAPSQRRKGRRAPPLLAGQWAPGPRAVCLRLCQGNFKQEKSLYRGWKGESGARSPAAEAEEDEWPQVRTSS